MAASGAPRPILVTGAAGFVGSHLLERLSPAAGAARRLVSSGRRTRRAAPGRRMGLGRDARSRGGRARARRPRSLGGLSPRRRRTCRPVVAAHASRPTKATSSRRITCSTRLRRLGQRPRVLVDRFRDRVRAAGSQPITRRRPLGPQSPYATSKLAQELLARRAWTDDGIPSGRRAIVQSHRAAAAPVVRRVRHRAADCVDRSGTAAARADARQSRAEARPDGRARHGPRLRRHDGDGHARSDLQRLLRARRSRSANWSSSSSRRAHVARDDRAGSGAASGPTTRRSSSAITRG